MPLDHEMIHKDNLIENCNAEYFNMSSEGRNASEQEKNELLISINSIFYNYGLPIVCMFGIVGNILNITILTRRKLRRSIRSVEQAANMCLIALALSDLFFCLFAFPSTFLPHDHYKERGFILYYGMYSAAIINIFIMTSTWLTVTMATERYLAICHPLNQTLLMTLGRTKQVISVVFLLSIAFNVPVFWRYQAVDKITCDNSSVIELKKVPLGDHSLIDDSYRVLWAICGNIIPLVLLLSFNICICRKIHQSYKYRQKFYDHRKTKTKADSNYTLTVTLIVIVVMFLILVAPSELVMYIAQLKHATNTQPYKTVEIIMNFMQSVNFSVNFVLYCIISSYFRRTLKHIFCCKYRGQRSSDRFNYSLNDVSKMPLHAQSAV